MPHSRSATNRAAKVKQYKEGEQGHVEFKHVNVTEKKNLSLTQTRTHAICSGHSSKQLMFYTTEMSSQTGWWVWPNILYIPMDYKYLSMYIFTAAIDAWLTLFKMPAINSARSPVKLPLIWKIRNTQRLSNSMTIFYRRNCFYSSTSSCWVGGTGEGKGQ